MNNIVLSGVGDVQLRVILTPIITQPRLSSLHTCRPIYCVARGKSSGCCYQIVHAVQCHKYRHGV